jgi:2-amino-4-hydroxy-6-hydroxymethyldihydropteridine diphosphokinase
MPTAFISVGSNIGDKLDYCRQGIADLTRPGVATLMAASPFYKTAPVDYRDQDWFINAALKIETHLTPFKLLDRIQAIQRAAGRIKQTVKFGPRTLDLDIVFYEDRVVRTERLIVPHPRMHKRRFVLQPICDIDPAILHPLLGKTVAQLLSELDDHRQQIEPYA